MSYLDEAIDLFNSACGERDANVRERQMLHGLRCLAMSFCSHPAPPPSPSEENGGEGACDPNSIPLGAPCPCDVCRGYEAGKKHQASSDAATIAGLRRVVDAVGAWRKDSSDDSSWKAMSAVARIVDAIPPDPRPEPGGGK